MNYTKNIFFIILLIVMFTSCVSTPTSKETKTTEELIKEYDAALLFKRVYNKSTKKETLTHKYFNYFGFVEKKVGTSNTKVKTYIVNDNKPKDDLLHFYDDTLFFEVSYSGENWRFINDFAIYNQDTGEKIVCINSKPSRTVLNNGNVVERFNVCIYKDSAKRKNLITLLNPEQRIQISIGADYIDVEPAKVQALIELINYKKFGPENFNNIEK